MYVLPYLKPKEKTPPKPVHLGGGGGNLLLIVLLVFGVLQFHHDVSRYGIPAQE